MSDVGYLELLRSNRDYRRLWFAFVISMLGEWFNTIALFFLILEYSQSEFLLGLLFTVRMASFAVLQPLIGLLADRYSRKMLMVVTNVVQIFLALAFIMVDGPEDMWWMISLTGVMMILHGTYMTAERAALPNLVSEEQLATANALDAATWSIALCFGALLGGVVVSAWGVNAAFIIDSFTFLVSTIILLPLVIPQTIDEEMQGPFFSSAFANFKRGWKRISQEARLLRIVFAKASWNIAGGALAGVFLVLMGADVTGFGAAMGFGLFFFARGVGTGLGPIIARKVLTNQEKWPGLIGKLVMLSGLFYLTVGYSLGINLWLTVALVALAHAASGANWVLSTILTQQWVEDEVRGRVFSMDMLILSIAFSTSTAVGGYLVENHGLSIGDGIKLFAMIMVFSGLAFTLWQPKDKPVNS